MHANVNGYPVSEFHAVVFTLQYLLRRLSIDINVTMLGIRKLKSDAEKIYE